MRERVEDLGRISVLIKSLLEAEIFDLYQGRNKDFLDYFAELPNEKKDDLLHKWIYGLDELKDKLNAMSDIADGCDMLNIDPTCY